MKDRYGRKITYLRVSVTDECDLDCRYCLHTATPTPASKLLTDHELISTIQAAGSLGINKIRITGGEPLLRKDIIGLVKEISRIKGIDEICMTTNGIHLADYAQRLVDAGLTRVNVSLDSIDPEQYRMITGGGDVHRVLAGINAARNVGLTPVKLNCVVGTGAKKDDFLDVERFARQHGHRVRFIPKMNLASGTFAVVEEGGGGDCKCCNRLRLSCTGDVRPCLFSNKAYSIRENGERDALLQAILKKPERGSICRNGRMRCIGG
jgi:cyclic pyranopterin phosphate synthase